MDFTSEENYEVTKETVLARGKVVSIATERDSQNWDADIFFKSNRRIL